MNHFKKYLYIGIGGVLGATARYSFSLLLTEDPHSFPLATLSVNMIGCFFLTFILYFAKLKARLSPEIFTALTVGVLGSFTTFSTVMIELIDLLQKHPFLSLAYMSINVFGGIFCCYVGYILARKLGDEGK